MILALVSDLIFASKLTATAAALGVGLRAVRDVAALRHELAAATGVAVDLNAVPDAAGLVCEIKAAAPRLPLVAFVSHVQTELIVAARAAGADHVLARSAFSERLPEILTRLSRGQTLSDRPPASAADPG